MKTSSHNDVYQMITNLIIKKLVQGKIPRLQSWNNYSSAVNYLSRKPYRGINRLYYQAYMTSLFTCHLSKLQTSAAGSKKEPDPFPLPTGILTIPKRKQKNVYL